MAPSAPSGTSAYRTTTTYMPTATWPARPCYDGSASSLVLSTTTYPYDNNGRKTAEIQPAGTCTSRAADGLVHRPPPLILMTPMATCLQPPTPNRSHQLDAVRRLESRGGRGPLPTAPVPRDPTTPPLPSTSRWADVLSVTDPDGNNTSYTYDYDNRQVTTPIRSVTYPRDLRRRRQPESVSQPRRHLDVYTYDDEIRQSPRPAVHLE